ncbi:hypothetical protein H8B09_09660 [Paenibacillus sp. PR3]|uniref:DUF2007 domain-containing protein n=1 Tax=Paenibacillus terricola TaxID=2763503 RepID=A0ABR8MWV5_9BACL|nr:hypothetical protein [Paenibacillus terricola]MBD3919019.1 hypothetical protein [Paenibacillus terricola]
MELILILSVIVLVGIGLIVRSKRWKTLLTAAGPNAELLQVKYEHLKTNNVKCKLVNESSVVEAGIVQSADVFPNGPGTVIKLKVHEKDMEQAIELLEDFPEAI